MKEIPLLDQIACVEREILMRERVYPRRVSQHQMTKRNAQREIDRMKAVLETLRQVDKGERLV